MIQGRVRRGHAVWRCSECGAEQPIIQYILVPGYGEHIDMESTVDQRDAFIKKHLLCKKEFIQTDFNFRKTYER